MRDISYAELAWLGNEFDKQVEEQGVVFHDDEYREEALMDFVRQYEEGDDNPKLQLLYPERHTIKSTYKVTICKFDNPEISEVVEVKATSVREAGKLAVEGKEGYIYTEVEKIA